MAKRKEEKKILNVYRVEANKVHRAEFMVLAESKEAAEAKVRAEFDSLIASQDEGEEIEIEETSEEWTVNT